MLCQLLHYNPYLLTSHGHQAFYQKQRYTNTVMLIVVSDPVLCFHYVACSIFSGIFNVPKVLRFLDCGVPCLNFIIMILACSVTDSGFLECSCSVLGTSLV